MREDLVRFVSLARERVGYESVEATVLPDGQRQLGPFQDGEWEYRDTYGGDAGFRHFAGEEVVSLQGRGLWRRRYDGGVLADPSLDEKLIYAFLKEALRQFPRDEPFRRGPDEFRGNGFIYADSCDGDIGMFRGTERIFTSEGVVVHWLSYDGGLLNPGSGRS